MKTTILKYITVTFAAGAMLLAGCNDLDQEPTNKFTDKAFWTSPERANMVLNMAYNQMFGHDKIWQDEALSDNLYEQRGNPDTRTIRMGQATPNTGLFRSEWKWVFEGVKTCNVFMNFVDEVPGMDPERLAGMKAQIRFIRAFLYFRLANFYGDIPFFLQDISLEESRRVSRTPYPEVMSALHRELDEIVGDLPTRDELKADDNGRITKAAAMVLKARMYMYENVQRTGNSVSDNMRKAADICDKLIHEQGTYGTYSLLTQGSGDGIPAYEYLFTSAAEYNSEVILDYAAVELNKQWSTLYSMVPLTMGANLCQKAPTRALVDSYLNADGSVPADKTVYANRDPRLTPTVVYNGYVWKDRNDKGEYVTKGTINVTSGNDKAGTDNGSPTGFYTRKYFDTTHGKNLEMWTNIIMMRYADVLLMYAEAKAYLNEMDAAVWNETIKPIRQRAGLSGTDFPSSGDYTQIVRDERRVELALEGLRYFDLIRWITGREFRTVSAVSARNQRAHLAVEDHAAITGELDDGVKYFINPSYSNLEEKVPTRRLLWPKSLECNLKLTGTKGYFSCDFFDRHIYIVGNRYVSPDRLIVDGTPRLPGDPADSLIGSFVAAIAGERKRPETTLEDSYAAIRVMNAAYESIRLEREITLEATR